MLHELSPFEFVGRQLYAHAPWGLSSRRGSENLSYSLLTFMLIQADSAPLPGKIVLFKKSSAEYPRNILGIRGCAAFPGAPFFVAYWRKQSPRFFLKYIAHLQGWAEDMIKFFKQAWESLIDAIDWLKWLSQIAIVLFVEGVLFLLEKDWRFFPKRGEPKG